MNRFAPLLFVVLWSTGFIGAKLGLPHADALSFLLVRYILVVSLMTLLALAMRAPWPKDGRQWFHIGVAGLLVHAIYLGGVFVSISKGLPAGVASLVVGIQPLLTAVGAGWLLNETVLRRQWLGLVLGFAGVSPWWSRARSAAPSASTRCGPPWLHWRASPPARCTKNASVPASTGAPAPSPSSCRPRSPPASWSASTDSFRVEWAPEFVFALGWLVLVLSLGAVSLLNILIRRGSAVNLASLFYLVPPCTALIAWLLFDERLAGMALAGMALAVWGVYLARK
jgi:drug/metabolite transporter (DMT)-like permease